MSTLAKEEAWKVEERMYPIHLIAIEVETVLRQAREYRARE